MNAERLEIARRLVACPKWVWLPGMAAFRPDADGHLRIEAVDEYGCGVSPVVHGACERFSLSSRVPDLDDDVTRLGVLAVVRLAWGSSWIDLTILGRKWLLWRDFKGMPSQNVWIGEGETEETAMLVALEAAP